MTLSRSVSWQAWSGAWYWKQARPPSSVPVTSLRTGKRIVLVANLVGDAGEGIVPYTVNGQLADPVSGRLVTPFTGTELGGRACFQYQAPDQACQDTLRLSVTVEEGL